MAYRRYLYYPIWTLVRHLTRLIDPTRTRRTRGAYRHNIARSVALRAAVRLHATTLNPANRRCHHISPTPATCHPHAHCTPAVAVAPPHTPRPCCPIPFAFCHTHTTYTHILTVYTHPACHTHLYLPQDTLPHTPQATLGSLHTPAYPHIALPHVGTTFLWFIWFSPCFCLGLTFCTLPTRRAAAFSTPPGFPATYFSHLDSGSVTLLLYFSHYTGSPSDMGLCH